MSFRAQDRRRRAQPRRRESRVKAERVAAVGSLAVVAVVVGVIVLSSGTGSASHPTSLNGARSARNPSRGSSASRAASPHLGAASVPVLVYHVINTQPVQSTAPSALYMPTDEFSSQMQALKANGWHAVTLDQVQAYWTRGAPLGTSKPIVITFDNGYSSQYTNALPILKGLGWVGVEDLQLSGLPPSDGGLSDTQIRGLIAAGWELDTEGASHTDLNALDPAQLGTEVGAARETLHRSYGVPVNWFSYPLGDYNPTVIAAVRAAGYLGATTVNGGWASPQQDRFRLPRLIVTPDTTPAQLLAQIAAAKATTVVPGAYTGAGLA